MRKLFLAALLLFTIPTFAQTGPVEEGIALYDAGRYDEAIAKFKAALAADPENELAAYELGLTYFAKQDWTGCKSALAAGAAKPGRLQASFLAVLGNCLDGGGERDAAIRTYRRGLTIAPDDPQLLYNLAVSLIANDEVAEPVELLKRELKLRPGHASGHFALGMLFEQQGYRAPALLSYLRYLAIEPEGARAKVAAGQALALLEQGVKVEKGGKNITILVDPKSSKAEGDFSGWEMMLALMGAGSHLPERAKWSEFERKRVPLSTALAVLAETKQKGTGFSFTTNVPFFEKMSEAGLTETFAGIALVSLGLDGTDAWVKKNGEELAKYRGFVRQHGGR